MINEVIIQRLDELVGDCNTPFFNYLLYSYDLSLNECELIVEELKGDISSNKIITDNVASTLEGRFRSRVADLKKQEKIEYLSGLMAKDSDFYIKYLRRFDLADDDISLIYSRVESRILEDDITDFEIRRYLEYYFSNAVKQRAYVNDLNWIVGRNYDTLIIRNAKRNYPILLDRDIVQIIFNIHGDIIEAKEFKNGIKEEFKRQCMIRSESKKAQCRVRLEKYVERSGDSFSKLVEFKGLTKEEGNAIVSEIREDISRGLLQPDQINGAFITKRFNDYNERK
jgi:hypothetical protein